MGPARAHFHCSTRLFCEVEGSSARLRVIKGAMRNVLAIFQREFASYFSSALAYIIVPVFLLLVGGFSLYFQDFLAAGQASMRPVFFWCAVSYLLLIPALTMRAFAEESRTGSIELLYTLPIREEEMVLGKYLAAMALMSLALALTLGYPLTLSAYGNLDWGPVAGGYLGLLLLGAAFSAIGIAASASTSSQVVAFLVSLVIGLLPFATGYSLARVPSSVLPLVQYLSFEYHFNHLSRGVIDSRSIVYYGSVVALFLHMAVFQLEQRRLR
jgi:ABC-2 type transport system permease protein